MTTSSDASRRGVSGVEVMIGAIILGLAFIPIYTMFVQTREITSKSEMSYRAMHVAREQLQEIRTLPLWGVPGRPATANRPEIPEVPPWTGQDWTPVTGKNVLFLSASDQADTGALKTIAYPESYAGIDTRVTVIPGGASEGEPDFQDIRVIQLQVRWKEKGKMQGGTDTDVRVGTQLFQALAVRRSIR